MLVQPDAADEDRFLEDGCPADFLALLPHQRLPAGLSTGAGGLGLACIDSARARFGVSKKPLLDHAGGVGRPVGTIKKERTNQLPGTALVRGLGESVRDLAAQGE